jgi:hypothetical protein
MFNKTAVALAAASLVLGAAAVSPASANYDRCYETPSAKGCPGNYDVTQGAVLRGSEQERGA